MGQFDYVQYIVVRKDLVEKMGYGKFAAQVAHASLGAILRDRLDETYQDQFGQAKSYSKIIEDPAIDGWLRGAFTKLVVYVKTKQKLLNLASRLDEEGVRTKLIWDACRTVLEPEESDGSTLTCMGLVPIHRNNVPKCLQKLRLLD